MHVSKLFILFASSAVFCPVKSFDPLIGGGLVAAAGFSYFVPKIYCRFKECCTISDRWTKPNITGLQHALKKRVFGQHLVSDTVYKAVKGHLTNKSPSKALVLSFNGWTGSGKNFVSKIIAEHAFKKGMDSKFVHQIIATNDFPHKAHLGTYQEQLKRWVIGNVTNCARTMFIFDEMDKMPEGLIDVLKPFLEHYTDVKGVNYRKSIFIFLSNTGGHLINEEVLKNWKAGKRREDITIRQMDQIINLGAFNMKGGFWHSTLIEKNLIDYFIPFMPMERAQVKACAKADMEEKGYPVTDKSLNLVADELQYFPKDKKVFSQSGCKKVSSKVDIIMG